MVIKILGTGCPNDKKMERNVRKAIKQLGIDRDVDIENITDIKEIVKYGVIKTPGLIVDGVIKVYGRVPSVKEIKEYL